MEGVKVRKVRVTPVCMRGRMGEHRRRYGERGRGTEAS